MLTADGVIDGAPRRPTPRIDPTAARSPTCCTTAGPRLVITQNDVRQIQLAKAALYAGCRLLMDAFGVDTVDRIRLAGAFGAHIDPMHAMVLGMVPDCEPANVTCAGNAAGTGARIALLNRGRPRRDRRRRAPGREGRDRRRTAVPGALRGRDGASRTRPTPFPRLAARSTCRPTAAAATAPRRRAAGAADRTEKGAPRERDPRPGDDGPAAAPAARPRACTPWPRRSRSSPAR